MLQISLQNNVDIIKRLFEQSGLICDPLSLVMAATEQNRVLGHCIFRVAGDVCEVYAINAGDDTLADGLIRAALNFGLNRGAVTARIAGRDKPVAIGEFLMCRMCGHCGDII